MSEVAAPRERYDAVVIGSGPNGLVAAAVLARAGATVLVVERNDEPGGGLRTAELTLPGFHHDICSAAHPMGVASPIFQALPLGDFGLEWIKPEVSVAHPLDGQPSVLLQTSVEETAGGLGQDGQRYQRMLKPFLNEPDPLIADILSPFDLPKHPLRMARFGLTAIQPATWICSRFRENRAAALFAGCAAHSILPLSWLLTGALGLIFTLLGHTHTWPVARGGSSSIANALVAYLESLGVDLVTGHHVKGLSELPPSKVVLFDTGPDQLASIAGDALPVGYRRRLGRYRFGPGAFKVDWALGGPIPWADSETRRACTVHVGGTAGEIAAAEAAVWRGEHPERPYVLLVQQSELDPTRAPDGKHTGYGYCHVPHGSKEDMTTLIEDQIERFAPGFRKQVLARRVWSTEDWQAENPNYVGGAITGGVADVPQAFFRPVFSLNPYATPNPHLFICSASTPPGGGVHGMCGYNAAQRALRRLERLPHFHLAAAMA